MNDGNNVGLVNVNYYNPQMVYNRMGQFFYRTGEITKAKLLFIMAALCGGQFAAQIQTK